MTNQDEKAAVPFWGALGLSHVGRVRQEKLPGQWVFSPEDAKTAAVRVASACPGLSFIFQAVGKQGALRTYGSIAHFSVLLTTWAEKAGGYRLAVGGFLVAVSQRLINMAALSLLRSQPGARTKLLGALGRWDLCFLHGHPPARALSAKGAGLTPAATQGDQAWLALCAVVQNQLSGSGWPVPVAAK